MSWALRRRAARLLVLAASLALAACSGVGFVNALAPKSGYRVEEGLAYGADPRQRLDLYIPDGAGAGTAPVLVFFYGGRWKGGAREDFRFVGEAFASRGYVVAIPDYRLYPQVRFPAFVEDGAAAAAWLAGHLALPADRPLYLAGHSAGAYIAAMVALDQDGLARAGLAPCRISAAVGLSGPYDFLPLDADDLRAIFGPGEAEAATQPITYAGPGDPPMLLATGTADPVVRPANSERLAATLQAAGVPAELRRYEGAGHIRTVAALAAPLRFLDPVLDDSDRFLKAHGPRCVSPASAPP